MLLSHDPDYSGACEPVDCTGLIHSTTDNGVPRLRSVFPRVQPREFWYRVGACVEPEVRTGKRGPSSAHRPVWNGTVFLMGFLDELFSMSVFDE
jgi:hypothetical protein